MEAMLEGFIKTLDKEQFTALMSTGVLRPDQIAGLVELDVGVAAGPSDRRG